MFSIKKKMYAMRVYGKSDDGSQDFIKMIGVAPVRRDRCECVKNMYTGVIENVFDYDMTLDQSFEKAHDDLFNTCLAIMRREIPIDDLIMIKGLGKDYKSDSYFMKVFSEELKRRGRPAEPGSKLKYLVVTGNSKLGERMRLPEQYYEFIGTPDQETLDYLYYVENGQNIIDRIFGIAYHDILKFKRSKRTAVGAAKILRILSERGFEEHVDTARYYYVEDTGNRFITEVDLVIWITKQVIKRCEGPKKIAIQALKTQTTKLYHQYMNTERMVTGVITQNPLLTALNIFQAKQQVCEEIKTTHISKIC